MPADLDWEAREEEILAVLRRGLPGTHEYVCRSFTGRVTYLLEQVLREVPRPQRVQHSRQVTAPHRYVGPRSPEIMGSFRTGGLLGYYMVSSLVL